jgi:hypothetical protein
MQLNPSQRNPAIPADRAEAGEWDTHQSSASVPLREETPVDRIRGWLYARFAGNRSFFSLRGFCLALPPEYRGNHSLCHSPSSG